MKLQIASTMRTLAKPHCNNATRFTVTIIYLLISYVEFPFPPLSLPRYTPYKPRTTQSNIVGPVPT